PQAQGELQGHVPDAAAGTEDQQGLALLEAQYVPEPTQRRPRVYRQGTGLFGRELSWDRPSLHSIYGGVLGVEPVLGDSRANEPIHRVARMEAGDVLADGHDGTRSLGAEHIRELRFASVQLGEHSRTL